MEQPAGACWGARRPEVAGSHAPLSRLLRPAHRAECDRVAQVLGGRDRVLPAPARFADHRVGGARSEIERDRQIAPALLPWIGPQTHPAPAAKRYADDRLEVRNVAMPAELGSGG